MQKEKGKRKKFHFGRLSFFLLPFTFCLSSCGTPGDPTPPRPVVPEAVTDLSARQEGESVVLTFTLPTKSVDGELLSEPPDVTIYRDFTSANAPPEKRSSSLNPVYTVPSALVSTYVGEDGKFRFMDPLKTTPSGDQSAVYFVESRASKRKASGPSNWARVRVYPVPERIPNVSAEVTEAGVELRWAPPERTTTGGTIPALAGYRVYRAEVSAGQPEADAKPQFSLLSITPSPGFRDTQFEYGHTYRYTVRSVAQYETDSVESGDSEPVEVTPRDTFPPAAPRDLVVVLVPATENTPALLDLSWSISTATDFAGYHVYRSEEVSTLGARLNRELLLTPTFRDTSVVTGKRYFYRVTAVDRAGNESAPSAPASGELPAPAGTQSPAP